MSQLLDPMHAAPLERRAHIRRAARVLQDEFAGTLSEETILRFIAESYTALHGSRVQGFLPLFVERFTRQRLKALVRLESTSTAHAPMVVFLCVHNAGRSQMAAGWTRHLAGDAVEVFSGGSDPASSVNPMAIAAMAEIGIDIAQEFPKPWTDEVIRAADIIVTMGCGDACPVFPGKTYVDWEVGDPAGLPLEQVRPIREDIGGRVRSLLAGLASGTQR